MGSICCSVRFYDDSCTNNQNIILLPVGFLMSGHQPIVISNIRDLADNEMSDVAMYWLSTLKFVWKMKQLARNGCRHSHS